MSERDPVLLSESHWQIEGFRQRMTTRQWRQMLLASTDTVIFRGQIRKLIAKSLGYGIVEVYKAPLKDEVSHD